MEINTRRFVIKNKWGSMPEQKLRGNPNNWFRISNGSTSSIAAAGETSGPSKLSKPSSSSGSSTKTDETPPEPAGKISEHIKREQIDANPSVLEESLEIGRYNFEQLPEHSVQEEEGSRCFRCNICGAIYRHGFSLKRHFLRTHVSPVYLSWSDLSNCNINLSAQEINTRRELEERAKNSPSQVPMPGLYRCTTCTDQFDELDQLKQHVLNHPNTQSAKRFPCSKCAMTFSHKQNLVRHMSVHSGEKPYNCKHCGKGFPTATNQRRHERIHEGRKDYVCSYCSSLFSQSGDLKKHIRKIHVEFFHPCAFCLRYFTKETDLRQHVLSHGKSMELNSKVLNENVVSNAKSTLVAPEPPNPIPPNTPLSNGHHLDSKVLHEESKLYCKICKKKFSTLTNLRRHQRSVHSHSRPIQSNVGPIARKLTETSQPQQLQNGTNGSKCLLTPSKYFASVSQNIAQNLQHHVDGKLNKTKQKYMPMNDENLAEIVLPMVTAKESLLAKIDWGNYNFPPDFTGMEAAKLMAFKKELGLVTTELGDIRQQRSLSKFNGSIEEELSNEEISCANEDYDSLEVLDLSVSTKGMPLTKSLPDKHGPIMVFICHACGERFFSLNDIEEHKVNNHPNVYCTHLEIEGMKNAPAEIFHYRCSPVGALQRCPVPPLTTASTMTQLRCTKCQESFQTSVDLHKHILACGGYVEKMAGDTSKRRLAYTKINRGMKRKRDNEPAKPMKMIVEKTKPRSEPLLDFRPELVAEKVPETCKSLDVEVDLMCDGCNRKFTYSSVLERHQKTCLSNLTAIARADALKNARKQHSCMYCLRSFTYVASLKKHMTEFCPNKTIAKKNLDLQKARAKQVALTASKKKKLHLRRKRKRFPFYKRKPNQSKSVVNDIFSDNEKTEAKFICPSPDSSKAPEGNIEPVQSQFQVDRPKSPKRIAEQAELLAKSVVKDELMPLSPKEIDVIDKVCEDEIAEENPQLENNSYQLSPLNETEPLPKIEPKPPAKVEPKQAAVVNEVLEKTVPHEVLKKPKRETAIKVETDNPPIVKRDNTQMHTCLKCKRTFTYLANFKKHLLDLCPLRSVENRDSRPAVQAATQEEEDEKEDEPPIPENAPNGSKSISKVSQPSAIGNKMAGSLVTMLKHRLSDKLRTVDGSSPESSSQVSKLRTYNSEPNIRIRAQECGTEENKFPPGLFRGKKRKAPMNRYQKRMHDSLSPAQSSLASDGELSEEEESEISEEIGLKDTWSEEGDDTAKVRKGSSRGAKQSPVGDSSPAIKKEHITKYRKTILRKVKESTPSSKASKSFSAAYDSDSDLENDGE